VLVASAALLLALTLLLLAVTRSVTERGVSSSGGTQHAAWTSMSLPGGVPATEEGGIVYAPSGYSPPGIWTPSTGPGPVRGG
jgi:hypothetical protein